MKRTEAIPNRGSRGRTVSGFARTLVRRFHANFLMPSRLGELDQFLRFAIEREYRTYSILQFWKLTEGGRKPPPGRVLLIRHDVDTSPATAEQMWNLENALSVRSSYYFRLSTLDIPLMNRIENSGSEASYHYEELATICKRDRIRRPEEAMNRLSDIQEEFARNIGWLREKSGLPMSSVASHGDFVNRKLGINNSELLKDLGFRRKLNIDVEVYDESAMKLVESRHSDDCPYPDFWKPSDPRLAIAGGAKVVYVLVHPRQWRSALWSNLLEDCNRIYSGIRYSL
jgi:hypothetical protein